jgi:hypothetical protein
LFRQQVLLWEREECKVLLDRLHDDGEVGHIVTDLRHIFRELSVMHCELNKPNPELQVVEQARAKFEACSRIFVCMGVLAPFAYKIKFYDHALMRRRHGHARVPLLRWAWIQAGEGCRSRQTGFDCRVQVAATYTRACEYYTTSAECP